MAKLNDVARTIFDGNVNRSINRIRNQTELDSSDVIQTNGPTVFGELQLIQKRIAEIEDRVFLTKKSINEAYTRSLANRNHLLVEMWGEFLFDKKSCNALGVVSANFNEFQRVIENQRLSLDARYNCYSGSEDGKSKIAGVVVSHKEAVLFKNKEDGNWFKPDYVFDFGINFEKTLHDNNCKTNEEKIIFIQTLASITAFIKENNEFFVKMLNIAKVLVEAGFEPDNNPKWKELFVRTAKLHDCCTNKAEGLIAIAIFAEMAMKFKS